MRREAEHSFPWGADDSFVLEEQVQLQQAPGIYIRWSRADDPRTDRPRRPNLPSQRFEPVGQQRGQADDLRRNLFDPDLQQQFDRCAQAEDADRVERASLEAAGVGEEVDRAVEEAALSVEVRPTALEHFQLVAMLRGHE